MAQQNFSLLNQQQITNTNVTGNGTHVLYTSGAISNNNNLPKLRLVVDYHDAEPGYLPNGISVVAEVMNGSNWYPMAYQFEPYRSIDNGTQRIILLEPEMNTYNDGIDSIVYVGDATIARISRQQGKVGGQFRVRVILKENNYGTAQAFQSVTMSIYGDISD